MKTVNILLVGALSLLSAVACAPSSEVTTDPAAMEPSESVAQDTPAETDSPSATAQDAPTEANSPTAAAGDETLCEDSIGDVPVANIRVPSGATCTLNNTKISGDVIVEARARLTTNNVKSAGDLQAEKAAQITLNEGTRFENITITDSGETSIKTTRVMGDLAVENSPRPLVIDGATVHGQLRAIGNQNGVQINSTRVDGNLTCEGNTIAPKGGRNFIQGNKQGQCSDIPG